MPMVLAVQFRVGPPDDERCRAGEAVTGTKDDESIQRAILADCPTPLLIAELERRGFTVVEGQLPFEWADEDEGEALSA
jgi:hypothetical protein